MTRRITECFCSAHMDCREAALKGCGLCARAEIEYLERLAMGITKFAARVGIDRAERRWGPPPPPRRRDEQF